MILMNDVILLASRGYMAVCSVHEVLYLEGLVVLDVQDDDRPNSFVLENPLQDSRHEFVASSEAQKVIDTDLRNSWNVCLSTDGSLMWRGSR